MTYRSLIMNRQLNYGRLDSTTPSLHYTANFQYIYIAHLAHYFHN